MKFGGMVWGLRAGGSGWQRMEGGRAQAKLELDKVAESIGQAQKREQEDVTATNECGVELNRQHSGGGSSRSRNGSCGLKARAVSQ